MSIIIYIHKGNSFYLLPNLLHTRELNPSARIILLGDTKNKYIAKYGFEHHNISSYLRSANKFEKNYIHHSPNNINFELFCFQRWFIINDFVTTENIDRFLVCDTDAFIYCNVDKEFDAYAKSDFTITRNGTPCFTYLKKDSIRLFTDFISWCYTSKEGKQRIDTYYQYLVQNNKSYGISDMSAFVAWEKFNGAIAIHIDIPINGEAYDHNFIDPNDGFVMKDNHKLIIWENNLPYEVLVLTGEKIRIKGIHLQGYSKYFLHKMIPLCYIKPVWKLYLKEQIIQKLRYVKHKIFKRQRSKKISSN